MLYKENYEQTGPWNTWARILKNLSHHQAWWCLCGFNVCTSLPKNYHCLSSDTTPAGKWIKCTWMQIYLANKFETSSLNVSFSISHKSSIVNDGIGEVLYLSQKTSQAQKATLFIDVFMSPKSKKSIKH